MSIINQILKSLPAKDLENPTVLLLIEIIRKQQEEISQLKDEIARLKGNNPKPKLRPSILEGTKAKTTKSKFKKKKRNPKKAKKKHLQVDETCVLPAENVPEGSRFKGYESYTTYELFISPLVIEYQRERWLTPDGKTIVAPLPKEIRGSHFGPNLRSFILHQHYDCAVTQNLITKQLNQMGIDIGSGSISNILLNGHDKFHSEKEDILLTGLKFSPYINTDDTGARHKGKNGYCTHVGNPWFTYFETTNSKSRINFLQILRGRFEDYVINGAAINYAVKQNLPKCIMTYLMKDWDLRFENKEAFLQFLSDNNIFSDQHRRIVTEAALIGSIHYHDMMVETAVVSDDAGQFNVFRHALCWVHAERNISKLHGISEQHDQEIDRVRDEIWKLYEELKEYKKNPSRKEKKRISKQFDLVFNQSTISTSLDKALRRIAGNKSELLLVLDYPQLPLHNNLSENDIREYVKRRRLSGTTRSDLGRQCRDTFLSLKKTCQKLGISFWEFLKDRIHAAEKIPLLPQLVLKSIPD